MYGRLKPGHGRNLRYYDWGATPFYALRKEPRLSYCLYVPRDWEEDGDEALDLVVTVHGSERAAQGYRDAMMEWAETARAIVLSPLFPCNLAGEGDTEGYKLLGPRRVALRSGPGRYGCGSGRPLPVDRVPASACMAFQVVGTSRIAFSIFIPNDWLRVRLARLVS